MDLIDGPKYGFYLDIPVVKRKQGGDSVMI